MYFVVVACLTSMASVPVSAKSASTTGDVISDMDQQIVGYMLSDAVASSTRGGYAGRGISIWRHFLKFQRNWTDTRLASDSIVGLQEASLSIQHKLHLFILYAHFLKAKGVDDCDIYFKALAHDFRCMGFFEVAELLHAKPVMIARQFGKRDNVRMKVGKQITNQKEAVSGDMLQYMYTNYWCKAQVSSDYRVIDKAVACLAGWIAYEWGLRIGNLTKTASDRLQINNRSSSESATFSLRKDVELELDQHAIRASEVSLDIIEGNSARIISAFQYSQRSQPIGNIQAVTLSVVSSKSNQRGDRRVIFRAEDTSPGHHLLIEMLGVFIKFAQYDSGKDLFFSRVSSERLNGSLGSPLAASVGVERKRYLQSDINNLVKECAAHFNLDPKCFSSKSFKNGGITTIKLNSEGMGLNDQQIAEQFDHKTISANKRYQRIGLVENRGNGPLKFINSGGSGEVYNHKNLDILAGIRKSTASDLE